MKNYYFILSDWINEESEAEISCYEVEPMSQTSMPGHVSKVIKHNVGDFLSSSQLTLQDNIKYIAVLPSEFINQYHLTIPARKKSDLMNMIPFSLEDEVAEKMDDIHWMVVNWKPKESVDIVTINKHRFEKVLSWFKEKGIILDDIIPDYMLLPIHPQTSHSLAKTNDDRSLVYYHKTNSGYALDASLFDIWWQDTDNKNGAFAVNDDSLAEQLINDGGDNISYWDFGSSVEQWLAFFPVSSRHLQPYLLRDDYAKPVSQSDENRRYYTKAISILIIALISYVFLSLLNYGYQSFKLYKVNHKVERSFDDVFGNEQYQANQNDWLQIRQQINRIKGRVDQQSTYFTLMTMLSPVLGQYGQTLNQIQFDGVVLNASTQVSSFDELNDVVNVFRNLYPSAIIRISESERTDNKVIGNYQIELKGI